MVDLELIELLNKKNSGSITLLEQRRLQEILDETEEYAVIANVINHIYSLPIYKNIDDTEVWKAIHSKINQPEDELPLGIIRTINKVSWFKLSAVAASLIFLIFLSLYNIYPSESNDKKRNVVVTKPGSRTNLILPDGSKVCLNADSRITYNDEFGKGKRELTLIGEAYFDIVKDVEHPFHIHTMAMDVKVLGTAFNIRAYPNDKTTETALFRGSIQVTINKNREKKIILQPNEKITVQNSYAPSNIAIGLKEQSAILQPLISITSIIKVGADSMDVESQWVNNKLVFYHKSLENIATEISRWFSVYVIIEDEKLKAKEYNGVFTNQNLQQVMESLKLAGGFNYTIQNNIVTIMP